MQAWLDVLDTVQLRGLEVPASATTGDIVRLALRAMGHAERRSARKRGGGDSDPLLLSGLVWLGDRADAVAFGRVTYTSREARRAWESADRVRAAAYRAAPLPRRIGMYLDSGRISRSLRLRLPRIHSIRSTRTG